jgi:hypothetical protein
MKMMFDGLNLPFEFLNSRYGREARERERERERDANVLYKA